MLIVEAYVAVIYGQTVLPSLDTGIKLNNIKKCSFAVICSDLSFLYSGMEILIENIKSVVFTIIVYNPLFC